MVADSSLGCFSGFGKVDDPVFLVVAIQKTVEAVQVMAFVFQLGWDGQCFLFVGLPEQVCYAITPLFHDGWFGEVERLPLGIVIVKPATGDRQMNMHIPLQVTAKGMQDSENTREHTWVRFFSYDGALFTTNPP